MAPSNTTDVNSTALNNTIFMKRILPTLYVFLFCGALVLNSLATWIFFRISNQSSFIVYLKNMVAADIFMTLSFPFKIIGDFGLGNWQLRVIVCRYSAVVFYLNMYIGIIFLALISLERFIKVVRNSGNSIIQSVTISKSLSAGIWLMMLILLVPNSILTNENPTEETSKHCFKLKSSLGMKWHKVSTYFCIIIFWVSFSVLLFCYTSIAVKIYKSYKNCSRDNSVTRRKFNRNIFSVLIVFIVCFVPYHVCRIPYTLSQTGISFSYQGQLLLFHFKEGTLFLSAMNVCLDPVIYFLLCKTFRRLLMQTFSKTEIDVSKRMPSSPNSESIL
ncbi:P2Y purinoceptor 14-like [Erpetoichthys calabaricus]|uniref:P2Y purinoceptor 14-like n=1 Tax=Erpetoichthys calabaricus TaxID=27687 RepID=UPI0022349F5A|nr:P2Y purinoceptor 14-like [Erpetoichthys calabaricus]XP_051779950.1 P2Y purinoceptor 14-like [Erpetoichthys calabaricus]